VTLILIMYVAGGLFLTVLSIPLVQKRIPPNPWYGFHVPQTLNNPALWYPANANAGMRLFWSGIAICVGAIALYRVPNLSLDVYALGCLAVTFVALAIGIIQSWRCLHPLGR